MHSMDWGQKARLPYYQVLPRGYLGSTEPTASAFDW